MREIILPSGHITQIDDADYDWLNQYKWHVIGKHHGVPYVRGLVNGRNVGMNRLILGILDEPDVVGEHIDRNSLNNQRSNLRKATRSQNEANKASKGVSKYRGVCYKAKNHKKPWEASAQKEGKWIFLGNYRTEEEAAWAYNRAATQLHGEFAALNEVPNPDMGSIHTDSGPLCFSEFAIDHILDRVNSADGDKRVWNRYISYIINCPFSMSMDGTQMVFWILGNGNMPLRDTEFKHHAERVIGNNKFAAEAYKKMIYTLYYSRLITQGILIKKTIKGHKYFMFSNEYYPLGGT